MWRSEFDTQPPHNESGQSHSACDTHIGNRDRVVSRAGWADSLHKMPGEVWVNQMGSIEEKDTIIPGMCLQIYRNTITHSHLCISKSLVNLCTQGSQHSQSHFSTFTLEEAPFIWLIHEWTVDMVQGKAIKGFWTPGEANTEALIGFPKLHHKDKSKQYCLLCTETPFFPFSLHTLRKTNPTFLKMACLASELLNYRKLATPVLRGLPNLQKFWNQTDTH